VTDVILPDGTLSQSGSTCSFSLVLDVIEFSPSVHHRVHSGLYDSGGVGGRIKKRITQLFCERDTNAQIIIISC